jgi:hypothetical protein
MMLLFWGGLFAVVVVILRHFTSGSLRQRNVSPLGSQRGLYRWVTAEVPSIAYRIRSTPSCSTSPTPPWTPSTGPSQPPTRPA